MGVLFGFKKWVPVIKSLGSTIVACSLSSYINTLYLFNIIHELVWCFSYSIQHSTYRATFHSSHCCKKNGQRLVLWAGDLAEWLSHYSRSPMMICISSSRQLKITGLINADDEYLQLVGGAEITLQVRMEKLPAKSKSGRQVQPERRWTVKDTTWKRWFYVRLELIIVTTYMGLRKPAYANHLE